MATPERKPLQASPPPESWDDWTELDARAWPRRVERHYQLIPTICFNCEAGCGLLAFVDKETGEIRKLEGHPSHPASRGRNCAKGPATLSQIKNPERILHPLRRTGPRGSGKWEQVSWEQALDDIAGRIRQSLAAGHRDRVVYHVGRPGEDMYTERVLQTWGVDGHNSHTNVCSASARLGYTLWMGADRPTPDHEQARFMLLMSSHLESGHYFNPQAQRIVEAKGRGSKLAVVDTRLSNTAAAADYWLSPEPGTEAGMLLGMANVLLNEGLTDEAFLQRWTNWRELMEDQAHLEFLAERGFVPRRRRGTTYSDFRALIQELYAPYTPEWAEAESGVPAASIRAVAHEIGRAGHAFAAHIWRNAAAGHRGGWMTTRCLFLLSVLVGAVGTEGGTLPNAWCKFVPRPHTLPDPLPAWNEMHWPKEFPLTMFELSFLLPHLLAEADRSLDVYFTRVYNPVWTNPDGFSWIEMLQHPDRIGCHVALTPVWSETAQYADYVLPMGMGPERHDLVSYETHAGQHLSFRQPVGRVWKERRGERVEHTYDANPGEVWEENELWIELSWRIDPDGSLGIRKHYESPYRPGEKITIDEYYSWMFENAVPGLPEAAEREGLSPLQYMRKHGFFEVTREVHRLNERPLPPVEGATVDDHGRVWAPSPLPKDNFRPWPGPFLGPDGRHRVGVSVLGRNVAGFATPSGLLEFFSTTLRDWGWPEYALPIHPRDAAQREAMPHILSQCHPATLNRAAGEMDLLPTFRLPTLIHTRTNGAKWLHEISQVNPVWLHPSDAARIGVSTGDLVRLESEIGHFVDRVWVTEGIRPGTVACSHHLGRWRLHEDQGSDRWNSAKVALERTAEGVWRMAQEHGTQPFASSDPDSSRIWWREAGVHQNLVFPVQPDPLSGQQCWHQRVVVKKAGPGDKYGDIAVDTGKARETYRRWLKLCRPAPGPGGLRRPLWMLRPLHPAASAYKA
jgi:anaerobic selenocysteine-containing dehydrogenase